MLNIIGKKYYFLTFSGLIVLLSVYAILNFGLRQGIDFVGGTMWNLKFDDTSVTAEVLKDFVKTKLAVDDVAITPSSDGTSYLLRFKEMSEPEHQKNFAELKKTYQTAQELSFESIGPTIGGELRQRAIWAFIFVIFGISLYIAFAFRKVSYPVSSWKYGVITLITLFHDAIIPAGLFALMGRLFNAEVDTNFVVAILVVMGFSVHDTIVVFDRIRENLRLEKSSKLDFNGLVNKSVNDTMARSINTSLTLVLVLMALYFFGSTTLNYFVLTILVGTVFGTYSSIFIASPLLTIWNSSGSISRK